MHPRSAALVPPLTPAEMTGLVCRAGLTLNAGQMADLVLAWRHLAEQIACIPRDRPLRDDWAGYPPVATGAATGRAPGSKSKPARARRRGA